MYVASSPIFSSQLVFLVVRDYHVTDIKHYWRLLLGHVSTNVG